MPSSSPIYLTVLTALYLISFLPPSPTGHGYKEGHTGVLYPLEPFKTCSASDSDDIEANEPSCEPREQLVKIPFPETDGKHVIEIHPQEVLVPRCGGNSQCSGVTSKCVPESTQTKTISVQVLYHGSISECASATVETHSSCKCGCDKTPRDCNPRQIFDADYCQCKCHEAEMVSCISNSTKTWDSDDCQCKCREETKRCSTGFVYDSKNTCECQPAWRYYGIQEPSTGSMTGYKVACGVLAVLCLAGICGTLYYRQLWKNLKKQMWMRSESERSRQPASNPPAAQPSVSQPLLQQQPKKVLDQPDTATPTTTATESDPTSKKDDVPV